MKAIVQDDTFCMRCIIVRPHTPDLVELPITMCTNLTCSESRVPSGTYCKSLENDSHCSYVDFIIIFVYRVL